MYGCVARKASLVLGLTLWFSVAARAGDWPQWRYDAGRGAVTPEKLPAELHLQWTRQLPEPRPAWPASQPGLRFDRSYSPVAAGKLLLVPSMVTDSVAAYDTGTGEERWRFFTDGPVRFAPIAHRDRVYLASDDGYLYCVDGADGRLRWKLRGGPSDRKVLGNGRLISTWPIRGGPVLLDGTIYFTAGIWPFMGIFVHAVDAEAGRPVWTNSGYATAWTVQPHNSPAFGSLVPRGHLAATEHGLVVPGGRTEPGRFDLADGAFLGFSFGVRGAGSYHVTAAREWFFVTGTMRRIADGEALVQTRATVHDGEALYGIDGERIFAQALRTEEEKVEKTDRRGNKVLVSKSRLEDLWKLPLAEPPGSLFLKAGSRFYAGKEGRVAAIEVDPVNEKAEIAWRGAVEGTPWTMLAADARLFIVTAEGRLYCFGADEPEARVYPSPPLARGAEDKGALDIRLDDRSPRLDDVLRLAERVEGYCVMFGLDTTAATGLARNEKLDVIAIDPNPQQVDSFRRDMAGAGLYGTRIAAHVGDPAEYPLPPYLAGLIYVDDRFAERAGRDASMIRAVFHALRPYGGTACLPVDAKRLATLVEDARLGGARVRPIGPDCATLVREGPLPGAADWTHQHADPANSVVSKDRRVKAPLGLLWFGGPPNDQVLPRHGHGPSPQVAAGRLFIEGRDMLRALDIYTGRLLWQKELPDLGLYYDRTGHQPGANETGGNYVSLEDCVYVVYGEAILKLDAATGKQIGEFKPEGDGEQPAPNWGFVAACEDLLVATSTPFVIEAKSKAVRQPAVPTGFKALIPPHGPLRDLTGSDPSVVVKPRHEEAGEEAADEPKRTSSRNLTTPVRYSSTSRRLVVMDRHSGTRLWQREAQWGFRHNNIAIGAGKLFCIDGLSQPQVKTLGVDPKDYTPRLLALDVQTGRETWSASENVFGTFLNYSEEHDVLLQAGSRFRDRAADECDTGMVAYRGRDGSVLWKDLKRKHAGPCLLHHDTIITQGPAYSLLTGRPKIRKHPLTGAPLPWQFTRNYGCNTAIGSEHLITFRSAAAGYYDLAGDGGTGNLGGFKSGCTSNLIVAGGLLNAPEYTRTCECRYQNQTSLAVVHDPHVEMWTFNAFAWDGRPVRRVGINFGAPGDRRSESGTLWLEYPVPKTSRGAILSPDVPIELHVENVTYFRHHSSRVRVAAGAAGLDWVAASGLQGAGRIILTLAREESAQPREYTVRLHFAEAEDVEADQRVFGVRLQGTEVLAGFDLIREAGPRKAVVREFNGVEVADKLEVDLVPGGAGKMPPLLCGIEVTAEGW